MIFDLPMGVAEEVISKLPMASLREVRSTCKKLNTLSKSGSFTKKLNAEAAKKKEFQVIMILENRVSLMSVNLITPSIDPIGKVDRLEICEIYHCEGLLLCITKRDELNSSGLLVWNPFLGQTRWIQPRRSYLEWDRYALGYDKSLRTHKILRFVDDYDYITKRQISEFEIYNLNTNSWKVLDVTTDWHIRFFERGLSLKGNTYWYAMKKNPPRSMVDDLPDFLLCFDFTTECFGPHLSLPFHGCGDIVSLSSVGEKQLAVLFQMNFSRALTLKIWISDNVEPYAVSWKELFLEVDMKPIVGFAFVHRAGSFLVDEENNLAVVLDKDRKLLNPTGRIMAYIIGKDGCFKRVDLGVVSTDKKCHPRVCSYVPSFVQIKQLQP